MLIEHMSEFPHCPYCGDRMELQVEMPDGGTMITPYGINALCVTAHRRLFKFPKVTRAPRLKRKPSPLLSIEPFREMIH